MQTLGASHSPKSFDFLKIHQARFLSTKMLPLVQISAKLYHVCGSKGQNFLINGPCIDAVWYAKL